MLAAEHLLTRLQVWLQARNRGVLALELEWTLDLRRLDGVRAAAARSSCRCAPRSPRRTWRTCAAWWASISAAPRCRAPANHLRLRSLETVPWGGATTSLLPEDNARASSCTSWSSACPCGWARSNVVVPVAQRRPPARSCRMQAARAAPARQAPRRQLARCDRVPQPASADALYPPWLLPQPLRLKMQGETPCFGGPLRRLTRLYRVETAWWDERRPDPARLLRRAQPAGRPAVDLPRAARATGAGPGHLGRVRWYLQGLYA